MATFPLVASTVKPGGGLFGAIRSWMSLTKSYFNPMSTPQPMTENDIQKHLYPAKAINIDCRVISSEQEL
jgi:hypothetical protein